jgi:hypothetical protein
MRTSLLLTYALAGVAHAADDAFDPLSYVDPLIGTANEGNGRCRSGKLLPGIYSLLVA